MSATMHRRTHSTWVRPNRGLASYCRAVLMVLIPEHPLRDFSRRRGNWWCRPTLRPQHARRVVTHGTAAAGSKEYVSMALAQAIVGAVIFVLCAVFRLGFLANFLSEPILVGFVGGLALDILVSQIAKMLGVKIDSDAEFIEKLEQLFSRLGTLNGWSVLISVLSLAILLVGQRIAGKAGVFARHSSFWSCRRWIVSLGGLAAEGGVCTQSCRCGSPTLTWPRLSASQWVSSSKRFCPHLVCMAEGCS